MQHSAVTSSLSKQPEAFAQCCHGRKNFIRWPTDTVSQDFLNKWFFTFWPVLTGLERTKVSSVCAFQSSLLHNFQNSLAYLCLNAVRGQDWCFLSFLLNPCLSGCRHHCCSSICCQKHLPGCREGWLLPQAWRVPTVSIRASPLGPVPPLQPGAGQPGDTGDSPKPGRWAPPQGPAQATLYPLSVSQPYPGDILSPSTTCGP